MASGEPVNKCDMDEPVTVDEHRETSDAPLALDAGTLPPESDVFYSAGDGYDVALAAAVPVEQPVLERLGQPTFRTSNFPLMGLLESVYEHVAEHVAANGPIAPPPANA